MPDNGSYDQHSDVSQNDRSASGCAMAEHGHGRCDGDCSRLVHGGEVCPGTIPDGGGVRHQPQRGDDVEAWLRRRRNLYAGRATIADGYRFEALDALLDRYRECSDYGLSLEREDDERGDP